MKTIFSIMLCALALVVGPAMADTPINQTHTLQPNAQLSVSNVAGTVTVHVWDKHEVGLTGTLGENAKLDISGDADHLKIKIKQAKDGNSGWFGSSHMGATTLELMVPKEVNLDVDTVSARITADGLSGGKLALNTVSGDMRVNAVSPEVKVNSVSGTVQLTGTSHKLDITTVSGDVQVDKAGKQAQTQTVSGSIEMHGGPFRHLAVETVSGDITLAGTMAHDVLATLHSMSGDIHLRLDGSPQLTLGAKSLSGDIRSKFGQVKESAHGPNSNVHFTLGDGQGQITLNSFSGDIDIR